MTRDEALKVLGTCPKQWLEAAAVLAETQEIKGGYFFDGNESYWEDDDAEKALSSLSEEFRNLATHVL